MKHRIQEELVGVLVFVGAVWGAYFVDWVVPVDFSQWGVRPRTWMGLVGVPLAPFLHADFWHLFSNTFPLLVLLTLLAGSRANSAVVVLGLIVVSGALLWLVGRNANHIGASALIFGLITFLVAAGVLERRPVALVIAAAVAFFYGGTLVWGILPVWKSPVSWEGHLCGAVAGVGLALLMTRDTKAQNQLH